MNEPGRDAEAVRTSPAIPRSEPANEPFSNRFLLVTVACRRVLQIRSGSRVRVAAGSHKPVALAVAEVLAGCVPYVISQ
jgi:DNA-directed RNA polymerase omega subunit